MFTQKCRRILLESDFFGGGAAAMRQLDDRLMSNYLGIIITIG